MMHYGDSQSLKCFLCFVIAQCRGYCLCCKDVLGVTVNHYNRVGHYAAFTSPNWCAEAGAGGNLQECQLSIPETLPPAHLVKGQIDGPAGSSASIRKLRRRQEVGLAEPSSDLKM